MTVTAPRPASYQRIRADWEAPADYWQPELCPTPKEVRLLADVGMQRWLHAVVTLGKTDRYGADPATGFQSHIEGALGEGMVARGLNLWYRASISQGGPDVGPLQVRTSGYGPAKLRLHPGDRDRDPFVLVTYEVVPRRGPVFTLRGWLWAHEGKQPQYWGDQCRNNRPAFWVPQTDLRDLRTVPLLLVPGGLMPKPQRAGRGRREAPAAPRVERPFGWQPPPEREPLAPRERFEPWEPEENGHLGPELAPPLGLEYQGRRPRRPPLERGPTRRRPPSKESL